MGVPRSVRLAMRAVARKFRRPAHDKGVVMIRHEECGRWHAERTDGRVKFVRCKGRRWTVSST